VWFLKIIFLDVDGVLNTNRYSKEQIQKNNGRFKFEMIFNFDPRAMENLKEIVDSTNAYIVISSTWRLGHDDEEDEYWTNLIKNLKEYDLDKKVIGITPIIPIRCDTEIMQVTRGDEIMRWLNENSNKKIEKFAIIDDENLIKGPLKNYLVRCNSYYGITKGTKKKVIDLLS